MYPLSELAADGIPVTVSCRVLGLARQPYYRWLEEPIVESQLDEAYLANAIHDADRDDPEFGYGRGPTPRRSRRSVGPGRVAHLP